MEIDFAVDDGVGFNGNVREESLFPVTLYGIADFRSGHFVGVSYNEVRDVDKQFVIVSFDAVNGESSEHIFGVFGRIDDFGLHQRLSEGRYKGCEGDESQEKLLEMVH